MTITTSDDLAAMSRPELLQHVGRAVFGADWQSPLARAVGLNLRTMQRIASAAAQGSDYPVAPGVLADLQQFVATRAAELNDLSLTLEQVVPGEADAR